MIDQAKVCDMGEKILRAFQNFNFPADIIDILLLTVVLYYLYKLVSVNNSSRIIVIMIVSLTIGVLAVAANMPATTQVFTYIFVIIALGITNMFAPEIKREIWKRNRHSLFDSISKEDCSDEDLMNSTAEITKAVQNMAKKDIGALIVLTNGSLPTGIIESGTVLNSLVSAPLLECIFNPKTPLHDGAVVIKGNRIIAAGCFLPLSQELNLPKEIGTRHRAGIGISETSNVLAIVASEETGIISICQGGVLKRYVDSAMLKQAMETFYGLSNEEISKHTIKWSLKRK